MTSNPLGAAWMLWLQNDTTQIRGDLVPGGETANTTRFQPVMSFPFDWKDDKWNFIVRPVLQYQSLPLDKRVGNLLGYAPDGIAADPELAGIAASAWDSRTYGLGDTALLTMVGPALDDGLIWGVGASQIFPTAAEDVLGQGKWQAGPAALLAKLARSGWMERRRTRTALVALCRRQQPSIHQPVGHPARANPPGAACPTCRAQASGMAVSAN